MTSCSAPPAAVAVTKVPCGWRRRSVGEPGFSSRRPFAAVVSHGMWLWPKTRTSASGNRAAQRASRPFLSPGLVYDGEADPLDLDAGHLRQPVAQRPVVVVAVDRRPAGASALEQVQQGHVDPVAGVHDDVGGLDGGPQGMRYVT